MALHTDIPTVDDVRYLAAHRHPGSVSIYVSTSPVPTENEASRIGFKNAVSEAVRQLREAGVHQETVQAIEERAEGLLSDGGFWSYLSNSLAVFLTAEQLLTYRLPNQLSGALEVSDRYHLKPLLRSLTFPHTAFVLALAQGSARLVQVTPDTAALEVTPEGMPRNMEEAVPAIEDGRETSSRLIALQGEKVRLEQYSRAVDRALRPLLGGVTTPLILAAAEPLASVYRSVNSLPNLASQLIRGNPEARSDADLADQARKILDSKYQDDVAQIRERLGDGSSHGRVALDLQQVARAATFGAVDTLLVDIDAHEPGVLDEHTGEITRGAGDAVEYGIGDEIVRRALTTGATVLAVRAEDLPGDQQAAALLRFPV